MCSNLLSIGCCEGVQWKEEDQKDQKYSILGPMISYTTHSAVLYYIAVSTRAGLTSGAHG
jgi:hypothetical protein